MKLLWKNGSVRTVSMGGSVHGARLNGIRPSTIELNRADLQQLVAAADSGKPDAQINTIAYLRQLSLALTME